MRRLRAVLTSSPQAGFGMIELMIAMSVLSIGVLGVFTLMNSGMVQIQRAAAVSTAAALAEGRMESFRAIKFTAIGLADAEVDGANATYKADTAYRDDEPTTSAQSALSDSDTALTVPASPPGFPTEPPFRIKIDDEVLVVEAISGTTWTVSRGQDYTVPAAHSSGAPIALKQRVHLPVCGVEPCTDWAPTATVTGADGRQYSVDTYITWQLVSNSSGTTGRNTKLVTIVVKNATTNHEYARVMSTFDEATGL